MRTTSRRQIALILCILSVALLLMGIFFRMFLNRSLYNSRIEALEKTAEASEFLVDAYAVGYLTAMELRLDLAVAADSSGSDILVCSESGSVILCADHLQGCGHMGRNIGSGAVDRILMGQGDVSTAVSSLYGDQRIAVASTIRDGFGRVSGILLVSMESSNAMELSAKALRIFIVSALAVLAVAVLATPFLTRRETKPIQTLAAAARVQY